MNYRHDIDSTPALAVWYSQKYREMGDGWVTPPEECHRHLDDLGVPFDSSRTLLDVGCGAGHFLAEAEKRATSTGIEISAVGIEYTRKRCHAPSTRVIQGSIEYEVELPIAGFDYITSIGSLEHIVDLDGALHNIYCLLKPTGKFYFYCPNERWTYNDQPNERTMTDHEWIELFAKHGLVVSQYKRWGSNEDNTAFIGMRDDAITAVVPLTPTGLEQFSKLNCGSGQRPFAQAHGWCNIDIQDKYQPDLVADWNDLSMFADNSMEFVVAHHALEHVGCGEAVPFIKEAFRVLKPGGSLLIFVPNLQALAQRWLVHGIDDYTFCVNIYGAYMGDESDRHKWGYSWKSLRKLVMDSAGWYRVGGFDWRPIAGADIARDWWILASECVK